MANRWPKRVTVVPSRAGAMVPGIGSSPVGGAPSGAATSMICSWELVCALGGMTVIRTLMPHTASVVVSVMVCVVAEVGGGVIAVVDFTEALSPAAPALGLLL